MYAPHQVPEGPHHVYIFRDQTKPWFKIGETRDLEGRRRDVTWRIYGANSLDRLTVYRSWSFQNYYAGIHVEQATIGLLKNIGLSPARNPDWFEVDLATIDAAIVSIDELARAINVWEQRNASTECSACLPGKPYGDHVWDTDWVTVESWYEEDDGRLTHIDVPLSRRLAQKKRSYEERKRKMPQGLAQLIAQMEQTSEKQAK